MKAKKEGMGWIILRNLLILMGLFLILFPLYLVVINSFKTLEEAGKDFFALPSGLNLHNFKELFQNNNYWIFAKNSLIISAVSVGLILMLVPSVSYAIARNFNKKYYKGVYYYLLMGLFIPSQVIMLPVTKLMTNLNMLNRQGLILLYAAYSLTQGVFLFVNIWTLPLFQYNFKTEYSFNYTMAFTAYLMSMLPMLIVYCMGQKHIIKGLTAGSVKG